MLEALRKPQQDVRIELPSVTIEFNHRTKTVFMFVDDPNLTPESFEELEAHFRKRGYFLTVFSSSSLADLIPRHNTQPRE